MIFGVSPDPASSNRRFREKESLPFDMLADSEMKLARQFDVSVTNLLLVKLVARVTYLIGKDGRIAKAFSDVDTKSHAGEVLGCVLPQS
jgi:peroxiredoxin Q/BCP